MGVLSGGGFVRWGYCPVGVLLVVFFVGGVFVGVFLLSVPRLARNEQRRFSVKTQDYYVAVSQGL